MVEPGEDLHVGVGLCAQSATHDRLGYHAIAAADEVQLPHRSRQWRLQARIERVMQRRVPVQRRPGANVEVGCERDDPDEPVLAQGRRRLPASREQHRETAPATVANQHDLGTCPRGCGQVRRKCCRETIEHSLVRAVDAEALWRTAAISSTTDSRYEWLRRYGDLLCGAGWDTALEWIVQHLIAQLPEHRQWFELDFASLSGVRNERERQRLQMLDAVQRFPEFTVSLYGLAENLAFTGRFAEAEAILARLDASDASGVWANSARLSVRTLRGELPTGRPALADAVGNPLSTNIILGRVAFMRGDVDDGVRHWRELEVAYAPLIWQFLAEFEHYFAPGVVNDRRYMALLDELGLGPAWTETLRHGFNEIAVVYGLPEIPDGTLPCRRDPSRFRAGEAHRARGGSTPAALVDLSPAEHRPLEALQRGLTPKEYARTAGRSIHTVRNQLKQLLHKTGSRRQADLLRRYPGSST